MSISPRAICFGLLAESMYEEYSTSVGPPVVWRANLSSRDPVGKHVPHCKPLNRVPDSVVYERMDYTTNAMNGMCGTCNLRALPMATEPIDV